ncbi:hypothetical protein CC78DRAFT_579491 [Lojkania enalia]|uniref:Mid2 domain-containing protein n=1 Tax=Lojkania enalia TaxID=147567 RepID=A0A9P4KBV1_9PLEO|nr:hypothetical protein CC78DRAFT_579491 [Didymosphaeria enalia]
MVQTQTYLSSIFALRAFAAYDRFFFASEESNWRCPGLGFACVPPQACVHEGLINKHYCCGAASVDAVCWSGSSDCGANNEPLSNQIGCDSGQNAFCCLEGREECTQRLNQINICWATAANPYVNITNQQMNATFSSLSAAAPSASRYSFDPQELLASTTSISPSSSSTPATISTTSKINDPSTISNPDDHSSGLSGGSIAGIVVGVVGGLAIIGAGAFFFWRRGNKKLHRNELDANTYASGYAPAPIQEKYAHNMPQGSFPSHPPAEMDVNQAPMEVEGTPVNEYAQMRK